MTSHPVHDSTTSNVLAWSSQAAHLQHAPEDEAVADADEPPDPCLLAGPLKYQQFKRSAVRKAADRSESLLTKALHHTEEDLLKLQLQAFPSRRRSMNSSISLASTADLTSDTGLTSPARTNTPSPPPPVIPLARLNTELFGVKPKPTRTSDSLKELVSIRPVVDNTNDKPRDLAAEALAKKRCISFACGPKPDAKNPTSSPQPSGSKPVTEEKPQRRTCIKFACPAKPSERMASPVREETQDASSKVQGYPSRPKPGSPAASRKFRSPSANRGRSHRSLTPRPSGQSPSAIRNKYLVANSNDLSSECARFHEFASDEPQEEDWIRRNDTGFGRRLTINDTLKKENEIRRLGKEAEEEALEEEEEEEDEQDGSDVEEDEDDTGLQDDLELGNTEDEEGLDNYSGYGSDDDDDENVSDGYNTDNEVGFADSDDEDDWWTPGHGTSAHLSDNTPIQRRPSRPCLNGIRSDSSSDASSAISRTREKTRRIKVQPGTPELPDSTDFVCGTLDEDRALEDAYISCIEARRREKLHLIPQDIDPSFPTSEPEDEDLKSQQHDSEDQIWVHGEMEDLHHTRDQESDRRKKRAGQISPKRYHSPPPKRHHSPPPKGRGRSPKRLFDRHSPRRPLSPPPRNRPTQSPPGSLVKDESRGDHQFKTLAFRPGPTHTKSLPRAPAIFPQHLKSHRRGGKHATNGGHVRGAIDIVKGLEQKRQRRKEKFKEKYLKKHNDKARKGQLPQRPEPGKGAQRMQQIGLLSAGKLGPDQFVLSI
ncbi:hypothetical protein F5Y15DRAFT_337796 [Xylariaceae sp. FL0016]|nr:hypothetical protein F5Y15DRAFT_337796 [Xylariaceae sp. FL0016]